MTINREKDMELKMDIIFLRGRLRFSAHIGIYTDGAFKGDAKINITSIDKIRLKVIVLTEF